MKVGLADLDVVVTPGLGDNSYLLTSDGQGVLVDPQRDAWRFLALAEARGARVRAVLETHVHNDYVSGAAEVRAATGAELCLPAGGGYAFAHRPMAEGDELEVGAVRLVALATPGHTPEHTSYLVLDEHGRTLGVFTGGSLIVGSAGRTDLLGPDRSEDLTRAQFRSIRRLAELPDGVALLPTHGAGSFCASSAPADVRTSTLGAERPRNPALAVSEEADFVRRQLAGLLAYPSYYEHMAPINRAGARVLGGVPAVAGLGPDEVADAVAAGAWVVDARPREAFAAAHVPGSVNVELGDGFCTYVGWTVPFDAPIVLVVPDPVAGSLDEAVVQLARVGYERVRGHLVGGVQAWARAGRPVSGYPVAAVDELCDALRAGRELAVLDVRQPTEWDEGLVPGSATLFVGDLPARVAEVPRDREVWAICASGLRAAIAASLLDRAGVPVRLVAEGGVDDLLQTCPPRVELAG